jgi:hypothetical protein
MNGGGQNGRPLITSRDSWSRRGGRELFIDSLLQFHCETLYRKPAFMIVCVCVCVAKRLRSHRVNFKYMTEILTTAH